MATTLAARLSFHFHVRLVLLFVQGMVYLFRQNRERTSHESFLAFHRAVTISR